LAEVQALSPDQLVEQRRNRLAAYGVYNEG